MHCSYTGFPKMTVGLKILKESGFVLLIERI
jgi:hypothetical protein